MDGYDQDTFYICMRLLKINRILNKRKVNALYVRQYNQEIKYLYNTLHFKSKGIKCKSKI